MFSFKPIYFVIFALILCKSEAKISDKRLCVDVSCSELVSVGKTFLRYASSEENILSFAQNEDVKVYSHGAGDRPELVGVEIKGKRGYINKSYFRETRLIKRPKLLVDTEIVDKKPEVPLEGAAIEIRADRTQQPFEVVDGTRIPLDYVGSSTEIPAVNSDNVQGTEETTKPLDSVPQTQNVHPTIPKESLLVNTEDKNTEEQSPQQNNLDTKEDEDSDDESDDDDDEDDETDGNDEEDETEAKDEIQNKVDIVLPSNNSGNVSNGGTLETVKEEAVVNEVNDMDKESNKDSKIEFISPREETGAVDSIAGLNQPSSNILANSENITETVETIQKSPEAGTVEGSSPLVNTSTEQKSDIEENKDIMENKLGETKEQSHSNESQSLPASSTENPIEVEAIPPITLDVVTPNPINSQNIKEIIEEVKNDTEDITRPSDVMPEFKDPLENGEAKVEGKGGWGLGTMLPIFGSSGGTDGTKETDKQVSEGNQEPTENEPKEKSVTLDSTDVPLSDKESVQNIEPIVDNTVVSSLTKQGDLPETQNSDIVVQNKENVMAGVEEVAENVPETFQQDSLPQNLNLEAPEQNIEEIESSNIDKQPESSGSSNDDIAKNDEKNEEAVKEDHESEASFLHDAEAQELNKFKEVDTDNHNPWLSSNSPEENTEDNGKFCYNLEENQNCPKHQEESVEPHKEKILRSIGLNAEDLQIKFIEVFSSDLFLYLTTTALSVIFLVFGMVILDKCRRERPLIARINKLEQQLLTTIKENELLQEKSTSFVEEKTQLVVETVPNEEVEELNQKLAEMVLVKLSLEEQVESLQKELDTTTEVGIELNKIISEMLNSSDGGDILKENIEQMQKKLMEQQDTINTINETLSLKETENHELRLEMEINNGRVIDLQAELDRLVEKILKIEEERDQQHSTLENEVLAYQNKYREALSKEHDLNNEIQVIKQQLVKVQRFADVKVKEYNTLKDSLNEIKSMKNNKDALKSLLVSSEIKAQMEQVKSENLKYSEQLALEREAVVAYRTKIESLTQELNELGGKYDEADKEKVEINTKLQVLNIYFKEKEEQMQKEISKYESLWVAKEGEATSTTERNRHMQEELQNYKAQNESLKQEIVNQEVELKSQISMLEKKAHESWVANRQTERKLEETRQEAAQLRNRLTLRERAIAEGNNQARIQSPLHQNGELPFSPPPIDPTQSPPPPFFNPRDHITKSPPMSGMPPPPFLPPPLGASTFIPPPPLDGMPPPFMPPLPPGMFPGDHRPPPLGRMSSPPPVGGRYTPESNAYSDYHRYSRSPSPPYDSEYGASPPPIRGYSPYQDRLRDDRREYKRPQARSNGRNSKGMQSSGSENDSLGKINKKPSRKV